MEINNNPTHTPLEKNSYKSTSEPAIKGVQIGKGVG
jgi:hypothetical protein